jgi:hypothetical protein
MRDRLTVRDEFATPTPAGTCHQCRTAQAGHARGPHASAPPYSAAICSDAVLASRSGIAFLVIVEACFGRIDPVALNEISLPQTVRASLWGRLTIRDDRG